MFLVYYYPINYNCSVYVSMFINLTMAIYIESIPNRNSPPAILLRYAKRNGKRIERKTLANLSKTPAFIVDAIRILLKGGVIVSSLDQAFTVQRSLPHGHVAAVLSLASQIALPRILHRTASRQRDLALAAIIARIISPASKLATARALSPETADSSLGTLLKLDTVHGNEILDMLDWLGERQKWIEKSLANRHLRGGTLILYDVTSSYVEGKCCALASFGYNRDRKRGKMQIVYGLLCAADGCPVAVEVFPGNSADPSTLAKQISKIRKRFNLQKVALVGDRGMITSARIREASSSSARVDSSRAAGQPSICCQPHWIGSRRFATPTSASCSKIKQIVKSIPDFAPANCSRTRWRKSSVPSFPASVCWCASIRAFANSGRKNARICCAPLKKSLPRSPPQRAATSQILPTATAP